MKQPVFVDGSKRQGAILATNENACDKNVERLLYLHVESAEGVFFGLEAYQPGPAARHAVGQRPQTAPLGLDVGRQGGRGRRHTAGHLRGQSRLRPPGLGADGYEDGWSKGGLHRPLHAPHVVEHTRHARFKRGGHRGEGL